MPLVGARRESGDGGAGGGGEVGEQGGQALGHRPGGSWGAVADGPAVDADHGDQAAHGPGHERPGGRVKLRDRVVAGPAGDPGGWGCTASSPPAPFACVLARIGGGRLLWLIFGSRQSGAGRRTLAVISVIPAASYTGSLNSASTISVGPAWLSRGSMPEVSLTPRVSVSLMWTPSRMPFAASVRLICSVICSSGGTGPNARARAEPRSRARCSASRKIFPW